MFACCKVHVQEVMHIHACIHAYTFVVFVYLCAYVCVRVHIPAYARMTIWAHVPLYMYICICMCTRARACIYMYEYIRVFVNGGACSHRGQVGKRQFVPEFAPGPSRQTSVRPRVSFGSDQPLLLNK